VAEKNKLWVELLAAFDQYVWTKTFPGRLQLVHGIFKAVESRSKDPKWAAIPSAALEIACLFRRFQLAEQGDQNAPDDEDDWLRQFCDANKAIDLNLSRKHTKFVHGVLRSQAKPIAERVFVSKQMIQTTQVSGQETGPKLLIYQLGTDQIAFLLSPKGHANEVFLLLEGEVTTKNLMETLLRVKREFSTLFWTAAPLGVSFSREDQQADWVPEPRNLTVVDFVEDPQEESQQKKLMNRIDRFYKKQQYIGVLLQGLPGTGKSFFARSLCTSILSCSRVVHIPRNVLLREIDQYISWLQPDVMVIDDLDRDADHGDGFLEFLETVKRESEQKGLVVIASVNNIKELDSALLRPGRFDEVYTMKMPAPSFRKALLEAFSKGRNWSDMQVEMLVNLSESMTPAEIHKLARTLIVLSDQDGIWSDEDAQIEVDRIRQQSNYYREEGNDSDRFGDLEP
jgi:SpoVK/Ycf46/Vps4 family AAA+-type ATPase